ncbi:MAG: hypothetical protein Q7R80_03950 [bacterium]|nr:hypothetical protein [bacterium]
MDPTRKTVLFMNFGTWGDVSRESQDESAEFYIEALRKTVDVEIAPDLAGAEVLLRERRFDAVLFRSRGEEHVARRIKRERPDLRVAVLSALPPHSVVPDQEIVWVSKLGEESLTNFARTVLGS